VVKAAQLKAKETGAKEMVKATLIDYTGKGRLDEQSHAAHMLVFTKSTRLSMDPGLLDRIKLKTHAEMTSELDYMAKTIPSSWEFIDVTFLISGVSRPCATQMTRTRTGSYAQQSQRVTDVSGMDVLNTVPVTSPHNDLRMSYDECAKAAVSNYAGLLARGVKPEDARGLLPANITTNLVAKYNFRNFIDLVKARESLRVQGEYGLIIAQMKAEVLAAWPWAEPFFVPRLHAAIELLETAAREVGVTTGSGPGWDIAKAIDLLRKEG